MPDFGCTFFPEVSQQTGYGRLGGQVALDTLDPFKLRTEFLKLDVSDGEATLAFLNHAGLWDMRPWHWFHCDRISDVWAGFRRLNGLAIPTSASDLYRAQKQCTDRLDLLRRDPLALSASFGPPKDIGDALAAEESNTLSLHIEWKHGKPQGIIQPVTLVELLHITLHVDMLTQAKPQVCERHDCGVRFTGRQRKFCSDDCARVEATREWRRRKQEVEILKQVRGESQRRRHAKRSNRKNK
jgi:hypothetical protein